MGVCRLLCKLTKHMVTRKGTLKSNWLLLSPTSNSISSTIINSREICEKINLAQKISVFQCITGRFVKRTQMIERDRNSEGMARLADPVWCVSGRA